MSKEECAAGAAQGLAHRAVQPWSVGDEASVEVVHDPRAVGATGAGQAVGVVQRFGSALGRVGGLLVGCGRDALIPGLPDGTCGPRGAVRSAVGERDVDQGGVGSVRSVGDDRDVDRLPPLRVPPAIGDRDPQIAEEAPCVGAVDGVAQRAGGREASVDGRAFDRETVRAVSDVWDGNTFPVFRVALARGGSDRERRARTALTWIASFGERRHAWMTERLREAGHRPERLLPPPPDDAAPGRDHRGIVRPRHVPPGEETARSLAADYDVTGGSPRTLQVERHRPATGPWRPVGPLPRPG